MRRAFVIVALVLVAGPAWGAPVEVAELDAEAEEWAGRRVTIVGELIGDYSPRSNAVWVQLNDDPYVDAPFVETDRLAGLNVGIGVRMPLDAFDPDRWGPPGGYRTRGPVVEVTGTFLSGGPEQSGDTFVQAESVRLLEASRELPNRGPDLAAIILGGVATAAGLGLLARSRWRALNPQ